MEKKQRELLTENFKLRISKSERAILDRYSEMHQRSINMSVRLAIAALAMTMEDA